MRQNISLLLLLLGLSSSFLNACARGYETGGDRCPDGQTLCWSQEGDPICVDTQTNDEHCGGCGHECRFPEANACVTGQCACASGDRTSDACDDPTACAPETGQCLVPDQTGQACDQVEPTDCGDADRVCADGFCTVPDCDHAEICDGLDNDCDGHTDATGPLPGPSSPLRIECMYSGDPSWDGVGICRHAAQMCQAGGWTACTGEVLPVPEEGILSCDGLDNDCNGCIDDRFDAEGVRVCGPPDTKQFDIVFIIDRSDSMDGEIDAVVSAVQGWATDIGTNPHIRFGLVNPTDDLPGDDLPYAVTVTFPLSTYQTFNASMENVAHDGGPVEPMHYATTLVLEGALDAELGFSPGSKRIIIPIHDESTVEDEQNRVEGYTQQRVCGAVGPNELLVVMTLPEFYDEWSLCTSSTGSPPTAMPLTDNAAMMEAGLRQIIASACPQ